jgi:hypothetical protein
MNDASKELLDRLRRACSAVYLATNEATANDLSEIMGKAHETIKAQADEWEKAREALKPFAKQADKWSPTLADTSGFSLSVMRNPQPGEPVFEKDLTMGDFRRARDLIKPKP